MGVLYLVIQCMSAVLRVWLLCVFACCSISVTAERWVPMLEVKEAELLAWLKKQKAAG